MAIGTGEFGNPSSGMTVGLTEHQLHACDRHPYTKIPHSLSRLLAVWPRGHNRKVRNRYATTAGLQVFDARLNTWIPDQDLM